MRRTRTNLLRRAVMWTAGLVLVVSVAAWLGSVAGWEWRAGPRLVLILTCGEVRALVGAVDSIGWEYDSAGVAWPLWRLPKLIEVGSWDLWALIMPLWVPAMVASAVLGGMCLRDLVIGRAAAGCCRACAYDLTGITGPCPECGKERKA
ncbi:MAG TPA: hypothetical protein VFF65_05100 [Phycisphaerales bacterium]|nr:hypothetical protein [Phycisphaerales bacterium]